MSGHISGDATRPAGLARNSVGTTHIVFFVIAAAAPLAAVVGASPAAFAFGNGAGVPGVYVLVGLLFLIFSVGFTALTRFIGSVGGFYAFITRGLGRPAGVAAAAISLLTYKMVQMAVYALFGVFVSAALAGMGITLPWWAAVLVLIAAVSLCGARNIAFSGRLLGFCMMAEITILFALDLGIMLRGGGPEGLGLTSFAPATVFAPGMGAALVFVVGSFMGFEATAIFADEAEQPERTIPRATYIAVTLIAGFYAFSTWAITQYYGPAQVQASAAADINNFFFAAAAQVLGGWSVKVMETLLIVSLFASGLSFHNTINRYFYALGRDGLLPRSLARVHVAHGSPFMAGRVQSLIAAGMLALIVLAGLDPYAMVFAWTSAIAVIGILVVQIMVSISVVAWFGRNPQGLGRWTTVVAPVLASLGLGYGLVQVIVNLPLLAGSDSALVWSFPWIVLATGLGGAAYAMVLRRRRPGIYAALSTAVLEA